MVTLVSKNPTLLDLSRRQDPDGSIAAIAEILNQNNEILDEMTWQVGNLTDGHKSVIRTGLPQPTWRKMYGGVQDTKSTTAPVVDTTGMLEAFATVDVALADLADNTAEFRLSESVPHIEGMNQEIADTLFFGNEKTEPEAFTGFAPRFNDLSTPNADNIFDAGGTGNDNASIWLIVWSPQTVFGIVPKGSQAGLHVEDLGQVVLQDVDGLGGRMKAYMSHYRWDAGLVVRDWRFVVRICNIDKSLLTRVYTSGTFSSGANLPDLLFQAMRTIPNLNMGRASFYMSRDIATWVSRQTLAMGQGGLIHSDNVSGDIRFTERFHGIPMRRVDVLATDEARVT